MRVLTADQQRVKDLAATLNTPIVFEPGGWDETLPDWLRLRVIAERVAMLDNGGWDRATDAEVSCYLYTASLNHPLSSDWTEITLYQAAKQMPHLYQVVPATPKELSDYQKRELEDLKRKIRHSQLKRQKEHKKEGIMSKRKLVLDEKEDSVIVGVMKEGADPVIITVTGDLKTALAGAAKLVDDAETKWAVSPKNPAYKPPSEPKKETKPRESKPAAAGATGGKPTEDLPLLSDKEKPPPAPSGAPVTATPVKEVQPDAAPASSQAAPAAPATPVKEVQPDAAPASSQAAPAVAVTPTPAAPVSPAAPAGGAPAATGQFEYFLKDGRGPFATVQAAMDEMKLDKATRPAHNRWDRLSTSLKDSIRRVEKKS